MSRKHHHQVSKGLQRNWASNEQILLLDKSSKVARLAGVADSFARKHFCSVQGPDGKWSDDLEDRWQKLESRWFPHLRRLMAGARDRDAMEAVRVIAAMHYVRTEASLKMHSRIANQVITQKRDELHRNDRAVAALTRDLGRPPESDELERNFDRIADVWSDGNHVFAGSMEENYRKTLAILQRFRVQIVWPREGAPDFIFGDQALVTYDRAGRVSMLGGLALGDANRAFLPLGPRLLALFSAEPVPDFAIPVKTVIELNQKTWEAAVRFIGASQTTRLNRALQRWDIKVETRSRKIDATG